MYKRKVYPDLEKEKHMNGGESWLRMKKDQEQYEKTIIELKGRAARFHKSSTTFWVKVVLQPKNK